jgi:hypothetical protein
MTGYFYGFAAWLNTNETIRSSFSASFSCLLASLLEGGADHRRRKESAWLDVYLNFVFP